MFHFSNSLNSDYPVRKFWLVLAGIMLLFALLRWPLLDVPMERDEGEYATIGLGILHGVPPYLEAYTMKLPGAAFLHTIIFWLFGASVRAIHGALLFTNVLTIGLVGLLGKRLCGVFAGLFSAAAYGTFTIGTGMFGFWLSAEHFAALFLVMGACITSWPLKENGFVRLSIGAMLLGASVVIKQHAALPAITWLIAAMLLKKTGSIHSDSKRFIHRMIVAILAFILPVVLTCIAMWMCGVFKSFRFWAFEYAFQYISAVPLSLGWEYFKIGGKQVFMDAPFLWIAAFIGGTLLFYRPLQNRLDLPIHFLLLPTTFAAMMAVGAGLLFRGQYFILFAPFAALLAGLAWSIFLQKMKTAGWKRELIKILVLCLSFVALLKPLFFAAQKSPVEICRAVYGMNPFPEYSVVAEYFRKKTQANERVAVIGSEPAIYFLADRRPAMPYLCIYEMMKQHPFARKMQQEAILCLEKERPRCMVIINVPTSWGVSEKSDPTFQRWLSDYVPNHYMLDGIVDLISESETVLKWGDAARSYKSRSPYTLLILLRKD